MLRMPSNKLGSPKVGMKDSGTEGRLLFIAYLFPVREMFFFVSWV